MHYKISILLLYLSFVFISCGSEKSLVFSETTIRIENNSIVDINIPIALGEDNVSKDINTAIRNNIARLLDIDTNNDSLAKTIEERVMLFNTEFQSFKNNFPKSDQQWEAQIDGDIMYQSNEVVSMAFTSYINTGGAHGALTITFINFDAVTGRELKPKDLFTDLNLIKSMVSPKIGSIIVQKEDVIVNTDALELPTNIGFSEDGIIFLYNIYEISNYATEITEVTIPYSEISPYLNYN